MSSITTAHIRTFIAERQEAGTSAAEINRELAVLRRAFNLAVQAGRLITRPYFPMLKERNTRRGFLEREQIELTSAVRLKSQLTCELLRQINQPLSIDRRQPS